MTTRHSYTTRLMAFVKDQPGRWIPAVQFEQFGRQAWRTRLSEARLRFEAEHDGTIENRLRRCDGSDAVLSEYRYVPEAQVTAADAADLNEWSLR